MAPTASASGIGVLSAFRLVTGIGIGWMLASTNAMVAELASERRRDMSVAAMAAGSLLAVLALASLPMRGDGT